jgi:hypothetical protein
VPRPEGITTHGLVFLAIVLVGLAIVAFVLAHVGGGRGITNM